MPLNEIKAIPGTHNSGAIASNNLFWRWAKCQDATLTQQLQMGVRRLDFRLCSCGTAKDQVYLAHCFRTSLSFDKALDAIKVFLDHHHTEVVFLCELFV